MPAPDLDGQTKARDYKPSDQHPWRNYANRRNRVSSDDDTPKQKLKSLKIFVVEIVEAWDTIELEVTTNQGYEKRYLPDISDAKVANWLRGMLGKYCGYNDEEAEDGQRHNY